MASRGGKQELKDMFLQEAMSPGGVEFAIILRVGDQGRRAM